MKNGMVPRLAFLLIFPVLFILCLFNAEHCPLLMAIVGGFLGLTIFTIVFYLSGKKLGLADIWYSALIGMVLGPVWWFAAVGVACLAGIICIIISKKHRIPFIPCMAIGGISISLAQSWF
ncbi:MAG: hypothetical protein FWC19_07855 [Treponema sp.]|nr:hypothetical protein [Treponema sp.]MCL2272696.1 hypothetical protein [Treponema sp.]